MPMNLLVRSRIAEIIALACLSVAASAAEPGAADASVDAGEDATSPQAKTKTLAKVEVIGRQLDLVGTAISASEGSVGQGDMSDRPLLRTGDLLEFVPGLVATQHSGSGKANQYFLRGFNLDHGTDFATSVDGMPVNMRTHGHGQGYTDLNFLIPETVRELSYRKGVYYADVGDFSSAGSAQFKLADQAETGRGELTVGEFGYLRGVLLDSQSLHGGDLLYAAEVQSYDGPWRDIDEDVRKASVLLRYSAPLGDGRAHLNLMGYRNTWNAPDQIPQRAVDQGLITAFGQLDTGDGGSSRRSSLSGGWEGTAFGGEFAAQAYFIDYRLRLWSNFTYFLDDPVNGDQFEQLDERRIYGFSLSQQWQRGRSRWRLGMEGRFDDIDRVGLFRTRARQRLATVRDDAVEEGSLGFYLANEFRFNDRWRSYLGARHDRYDFQVDSALAVNSGDARASRTSVKASLVYRPGNTLEWYASAGTGFHSNDARGTTIRVDPVSGEPAAPVDPLVGSIGAELGARLHLSDRWQATMAWWTLRLDSELLFVGDAGNTEASRPSRRDGVELGLYWFADERFHADLELSYTRAHFRDADPAGRRIPGAIPLVVSAGAVARSSGGWLASARLRHFGAYPLIEDARVRSQGSTLLNLRVGREWPRWQLNLDVLNALDSDDHDIDYYFPSRLPGEVDEGVEDIHFHVFEPRSLRLSARYDF